MRPAIRRFFEGEPRFVPSALYRAGQIGAVYDPAQWATTMYQDSAGTTPVTALEQPVGLMLDTKNGVPVLGPELVTNGDNEAGVATGANELLTNFVSKTQSSDRAQTGIYSAKLTSSSGSSPHYWRVLGIGGVPAGVTIKISGWVYIPSGATGGQSIKIVDISDGSLLQNVASTYDAWVYFSLIRAAKLSAWSLGIGNNELSDWAGGSIYIDNISVREIPGNHALMATAAQRPLLKQDANGKYFLRFDSTDYLTASFTPTAGSSATVLFETPSGLVTLPAQNVGTAYDLPMRSVDIYGIQIVDTAPTTKQQGQLERYWQAGVVPSYVYETISGSNYDLTADDGATIFLTE